MRAAIFNGPRRIDVGDRPGPPSPHQPTQSSESSWAASAGRTCGITAATPCTSSARSGTSSSASSRRSALRRTRSPRAISWSPRSRTATAPARTASLAGRRIAPTALLREPRHRRRPGRGGPRSPRGHHACEGPGSGHSDETMRSLVALSDVMCTGHHAAVSGGVQARHGGRRRRRRRGRPVRDDRGEAPRRRADRRIISAPARQALAREFGATDIVAERGEAATEAIMEMTGGIGVDAALECVGRTSRWPPRSGLPPRLCRRRHRSSA